MIRAILVDDEPLALQFLEKKLSDLGTVEVVKSFSTGNHVLKEMKQLDFQVAFLDIEMPGLNGINLAELIQEWNPDIQIVFVTASREYAIQAFDLHSIDYLVKPILNNRLEKTIARIQKRQPIEDQQIIIQQDNSPSIEVICFSEFSVYSHGKPVKWKTAKAKELFAFLITNLNTQVNRDTLIDLLWPDNDYQKAKIQLHTSISYLRKTLESLGYTKVLNFFNQSYALELPNLQSDAIKFEQLITDHKVVNQTNIQAFEQAIQNYNGNYMEKNHYEWATTHAQSLHLQLLQLLQKIIDYYTEHKNLDKKSHYLHLLLYHNPYSEHALQQLMQHYINIGNRGDAMKLYNDFKDLLMRDLGILPDHATNEIHDSILNGQL